MSLNGNVVAFGWGVKRMWAEKENRAAKCMPCLFSPCSRVATEHHRNTRTYIIMNMAHEVVLDTGISSYIIHDEMQNKYEMEKAETWKKEEEKKNWVSKMRAQKASIYAMCDVCVATAAQSRRPFSDILRAILLGIKHNRDDDVDVLWPCSRRT